MTKRHLTTLTKCALAATLFTSCEGGDGMSSDSSPPTEDWVGTYHQSIYPNASTRSMYTIELRKDFSATLTTEHCFVNEILESNVRWSIRDDSSIQFEPESGETFEWFGSPTQKEAIMQTTSDPDIVEVSLDGRTEGPTVSGFRRGTACLVIIDSSLGCGDGSYVRPCEGDASP